MPRRKTLPTPSNYEGMGLCSDNAEVQKARPLQSLSATDLTLSEFKILDAYLARVNSHDPTKRTVELEKGELEKALGVSRILKDDLNKRLRHLFQIIEVKDENKRRGFKLINLFEEADAEQDEEGLWHITLTCTTSAREYVFNIDNIGYLRYRLKNVINLTSRYSYVLFLYLLDNRFRKTWCVSLADLKKLLNCSADTYKQYYRFNDLVMKKAQKEIAEKTDINFTYAPIKHGRSVAEIEITILTLSDEISIESEPSPPGILDENGEFVGQQTFFGDEQLDKMDEEERQEKIYGSQEMTELAAACNYEFDKTQMGVIFGIIRKINIPPDPLTNSLHYGKTFWLEDMYKKFLVAARQSDSRGKPIKNRYSYFCRMLEKENSELSN